MTDWQTTGSAVGTATPGASPNINIAYPFPYTWLSLDAYAQVMGIAPMPFNTAIGTNSDGNYVFDTSGACDEFWWQHDWQDHDKVSREQLVLTILQCEQEIMEHLNYPLAPTWIVEEVHHYPRHHRRDILYSAYDIRGAHKGVVLNYGKVIAGGRRAVTRVGAAAVAPTYMDLDSDGFFETARVSVATTLTDASEIKIYFINQDGDPEWEIRPCRTKAISSGTFTADFYTWQFIDPDVREEWPVAGADLTPIDISGNPPSNVVATVDVYREYNDTTEASSQLMWEASPDISRTWSCTICGGTGCTACGFTTQNGCIDIRDPEVGMVAPWPATYDDDSSAWAAAAFTICREPDLIKFWYYAGQYNQLFLKDREFDPLSREWRRVIARMATARLDRPLCTCGQLSAIVEDLRTDLAMSPSGGPSYTISFDLLDNPFGTRKGEVEAWKYVNKIAPNNLQGAIL